ncbi:hypothetical protein [Sphingobacterium detergens]|uniref:hypothetical protein n=1 Tax=Sphingobacterium detergens TaxID=1145106 RepID=UPI003AAB7D4D
MKEELNELASEAYEINVAKGYYKGRVNIPEKLCLIHSEVTEALEAERNDKYFLMTKTQKNVLMGWTNEVDFKESYDQTIKGSFEEEMADIIIRTLSLCAHKKIDISFHVKAKIRYNKSTSPKKFLS